MAEEWVEIQCVRCGNRWSVDLNARDVADLIIYRGPGEKRDYRLPCPRCGTVNVVTVAFDEVAAGKVAAGRVAQDEEQADG